MPFVRVEMIAWSSLEVKFPICSQICFFKLFYFVWMSKETKADIFPVFITLLFCEKEMCKDVSDERQSKNVVYQDCSAGFSFKGQIFEWLTEKKKTKCLIWGWSAYDDKWSVIAEDMLNLEIKGPEIYQIFLSLLKFIYFFF